MSAATTVLKQSIADLEFVRQSPGNIDVLLEQRRAELADAEFEERMAAR